MKEIIVVKVGTSTLINQDNSPTNTFGNLAASIANIPVDCNVVLVTSGAIGFGMKQLDVERRPKSIFQLQALASLGQVHLMQRWQTAFADQLVGQVLVTNRELAEPVDVSVLIRTLQEMCVMGVLPIINENDAVANQEITFGDNDMLAARLAVAVGASKLCLLTDQDGVQSNFGTQLQARVPTCTAQDAYNYVVDKESQMSKGGIQSKLAAAQLATDNNIDCFIASAWQPDVIRAAIAGQAGTKIVK